MNNIINYVQENLCVIFPNKIGCINQDVCENAKIFIWIKFLNLY